MSIAMLLQAIAREPSRPDECGRPLNRNVRTCERCAGTGFLPAPGRTCPELAEGWCPECQGLGWYAVVTLGDVIGALFGGSAAVALIVFALAVAP